MLNFWRKKSSSEESDQPASTPAEGEMTWDESARSGLQQALAQAPVPAMLKGKVKKELKAAAENHARQAGRTTVTAEDLMNGLLSKLPANMRSQVEEAMQGGPDKLQELQKKLGRK